MIKSTLHRRFSWYSHGYLRNKPNKPWLCRYLCSRRIGLRGALTGLPALQLPEEPNAGKSSADQHGLASVWRVLDKMVSYDFSQRYQSAKSAASSPKETRQLLWLSLQQFSYHRLNAEHFMTGFNQAGNLSSRQCYLPCNLGHYLLTYDNPLMASASNTLKYGQKKTWAHHFQSTTFYCHSTKLVQMYFKISG